MNSERLRVWLYARTARNENNMLEAQAAQLENFAVQNRYQIIGASQDIGSGLTAGHPGLLAVKTAAAEGNIDALLVRDIARISRDMANTMVFMEELEQCGVRIVALDMFEGAA